MSEPTPEQEAERPTTLGIYDKPATPSVTEIEIVAIALSVIWLIVSVVFLVLPGKVEGGSFVVTLLAVFMPVAMIWVAATSMRASRVMREESARLQTAIDAIRQAYVVQQQRAASGYEPAVTKKLDEIAQTAKKTESALATFSTQRTEPARSTINSGTGDQTSLELGTQADDIAPRLSTGVFIRALNFPETQEDTEGFDALRLALKDRKTAQLVQASQDVLTLLSQEGIYMDDLRPDMARPEVWRQFAQGARGRAVAALGGIRDRSSLALTAARMKQDPIFRDAAHHFLRRFDHMIVEFEPDASDADLTALGDTRTARAFMLLGRVAGTFD
ncbi:hypothetical protein RUESEDTHA_00996 [Ruegeria sp. THAF57]|uniref:hypothetical protein n=1 Tax=Ruegeria sp. THAF57 TaxID=2744555 RepID=UPI0015DEDA46|nr:hypothetical protein [Ruegeria sp. THAF57]CAD0184118.1 hypothetical protein RUESEDTHA_00996 [Ruegeria sp. THAF57]